MRKSQLLATWAFILGFTAPEVYDDFDRSINLYQEIFGVK